MASEEKLEPCPFCEGEAIQRSDLFMSGPRYYPQVKCSDHSCCAGKLWHNLEQWNTRAKLKHLPPRPSRCVNDGGDLERYGVTWKGGKDEFLLTPMVDGYWTPWHVAAEALKEKELKNE